MGSSVFLSVSYSAVSFGGVCPSIFKRLEKISDVSSLSVILQIFSPSFFVYLLTLFMVVLAR